MKQICSDAHSITLK